MNTQEIKTIIDDEFAQEIAIANALELLKQQTPPHLLEYVDMECASKYCDKLKQGFLDAGATQEEVWSCCNTFLESKIGSK